VVYSAYVLGTRMYRNLYESKLALWTHHFTYVSHSFWLIQMHHDVLHSLKTLAVLYFIHVVNFFIEKPLALLENANPVSLCVAVEQATF
jgi:hypothetical protein